LDRILKAKDVTHSDADNANEASITRIVANVKYANVNHIIFGHCTIPEISEVQNLEWNPLAPKECLITLPLKPSIPRRVQSFSYCARFRALTIDLNHRLRIRKF